MSAQPAGEHGASPFRYDNGNSQVLGWVMQRAIGRVSRAPPSSG